MDILYWILLFLVIGAISAKGLDMYGYRFESVVDTGLYILLLWPVIAIAFFVYLLSFLCKNLLKGGRNGRKTLF